ncbi:MAG TPA: hypothetical protein DCG57_11610 [Candidatus Riflebacteria bacterium]|jgi:hypothetical protein|nr:hypothetical protein [Candidatus Riflebacteria bacterium]
MMCCKKCPFNPISGSAEERCRQALCGSIRSGCADGFCAANIGSRCYQDYYVVNRLYQQDPLAESLVQHTLKTAIVGRDRALLLSLFHAASDNIRLQLWRWLEVYEPRSLWLLNPIFASVGLTPLDSMIGMGSRRAKYLDAIMENPYSGRLYKSAQTA